MFNRGKDKNTSICTSLYFLHICPVFKWLRLKNFGCHSFSQPGELTKIEICCLDEFTIGSKRFVYIWGSLAPHLVYFGITKDQIKVLSLWFLSQRYSLFDEFLQFKVGFQSKICQTHTISIYLVRKTTETIIKKKSLKKTKT